MVKAVNKKERGSFMSLALFYGLFAVNYLTVYSLVEY